MAQEVLASVIKKDIEMENIKIQQEQVKLSLHVDDMTVYLKNL